MKAKAAIGLVTAVLTGGVLATGFSMTNGQTTAFATINSKTPKDSIVFDAAENLSGQWDPMQQTILTQMRLNAILFDTLFVAPTDPANPSKLNPALAVSAKQIDSTTIEYHLRHNVTFQNGDPFTAQDVAATFEYASQPKMAYAGFLPGKLTATVVDTYTVRLSTQKPSGALWFAVPFIPILDHKDIAAGKVASKPNGTGPYKLLQQKGNTTVLVRNDKYWGAKAKTKYINWVWVPDQATRVLNLESGQADIIDRVAPEQINVLQQKADQMLKTPILETKWLIFRDTAPFKNNVKLRQAVAYAIDRNAILKFLGPAGYPANNFVAPGKFGYFDMKWAYPYNPTKAKELLKEAGYPNGQGLPTLEYITSTGFYPKTAEYGQLIKAELAQVGINVQLRVLDVAAWLDQLYNPNAGNLADTGWMIGNPEPNLVLYPLFHSGSARITGDNIPAVDKALDDETKVSDQKKRLEVFQKETFPTLMKELPAIPLFNSVLLTGLAPNVHGFKIAPSMLTASWVDVTKN